MKKLTLLLCLAVLSAEVIAQQTQVQRQTQVNSKKVIKKAELKKIRTANQKSQTVKGTKVVAVANKNTYPQTITIGEEGSNTTSSSVNQKRISYTNEKGATESLTKIECQNKIADYKSRIEKMKADEVNDAYAQKTGWYNTVNGELIKLENMLKNF